MKTAYYLHFIFALFVLIISFSFFDRSVKEDCCYGGFSGSSYSREVTYVEDLATSPVVLKDSLDLSPLYSKSAYKVQSSAFDYCLGSARLIGEAGMLKENVELTIHGLKREELPPLEMGMVNVTGDYAAYRMLPEGLLFNGAIRIILPYDTTLLPIGFRAEDIHTYYYNEQYGQWQEIDRDSVDTHHQLIVSRVNHFTDFINAVLITPEMPETQAYTPTTMNDIKVANPLATLNLMSPPSPNNSGTVNLTYPLELPLGRQGMTPNIALSYNSSGGNGWMGIGWDIAIPSITIDTRWGVPQYRNDKESEIYMLNGEQLATKDSITGKYNPLPHRAAWVARNTSGAVRYYPRTEGAFQKIVRHGTSPQNYWWEVIDKTGMRYYYGKKLGTDSVDVTAVLRDQTGNIAQWGLTEMRDRFDNFVYYRYAVSGLDVGNKYFYINDITYTGHGNTEGKYRVVFVRKKRIELGFNDVTSNGRLGLLEVNDQLLTEVNIFYKDTIFRGYNFCYEEGAYGKARLEYLNEKSAVGLQYYNITPVDCDNVDINIKTHHFSYVEEPSTLFGPEQTISLSGTQGAEGKISPIHREPITVLGGSSSTGNNIGGALTVGFGFNLALKSLSAGGNFGYSWGKSQGIGTMLDIDGDGLPDNIFRDNDNHTLYYCRQIPPETPNGNYTFSSPVPILGMNTFLEERNKSFDWGLEANIGIGVVGLSAAFNQGKGSSSTTTYFADVDGDGFPDIVKEGQIYYNRIGPDGNRQFTTYNSDTVWLGGRCGTSENFILQDQEVNPDLFAIGDTIISCYYYTSPATGNYQMICDTIITEGVEHQFPDHDAVRMWIAPYDGKVVLAGNAYLTADLDSIRRLMQVMDGVKLSIQQNGSIIQSQWITPDSIFIPRTDTFYVSRGDRFYFRMESLSKRLYDKVYWNPQIKYIGLGTNIGLTHYEDENEKEQFKYEASEDFLVCLKEKTYMPLNGTVNIEHLIGISSPLSADISLVLYINDTVYHQKQFDKKRIYADTLLKWEHVTVNENDSIWFEIKAHSNVKWEAIHSSPRIYYLTQTSITPSFDMVDTISVPGSAIPVIEYKPAPWLSMYEKSLFPTLKIEFPATTSAMVKPSLLVNGSAAGSVTMVIKSNSMGTEYEYPLSVIGGSITPNSFNVLFEQGKVYYIDYYTDDLFLSTQILLSRIYINDDLYDAGFHSHYPDTMSIFGPLYRGWGQFTYRKDPSDNGRIDESVLNLSQILAANPIDSSDVDTTDLENLDSQLLNAGIYDPLSDRFLMMTPDNSYKRWTGYGNITYISYDTISNTYIMNNEVDETESPYPIVQPGEKVRAINKMTTNKNKAVTVNLTLGHSIGGSFNWGNHSVFSDYIDLNGDRFPDIVSQYQAQYSKPQGGLSSYTAILIPNFAKIDSTHSYSRGITFGASFININKEIQGNPKRSKTYPSGTSGVTNTDDANNHSYIDMNGDGLPDKVKNTGEVLFNLGYDYALRHTYATAVPIRNGHSTATNLGVNVSFNICETSISGNYGGAESENHSKEILLDINGDGLQDIISQTPNGYKVNYNLGNNFGPDVSVSLPSLSVSNAKNAAINVAISMGIPLWTAIKLIVNPKYTHSWGVNKSEMQFMDMNADGYPDIVTASGSTGLRVCYNQTGKTNLLKSVTNLVNGSFSLDYALSENDYDCPQRTWTMSSLKIYDGHQGDGIDTLYYTYTYDSARYDRFDRESLGFKIVKTEQRNIVDSTLYRVITEKYHNTEYMRKGLRYYELIADGSGNKYIEKLYHYALKEIETGIEIPDNTAFCYGEGYPALNEEWVKYYEGGATAQIITRKKYDHGPYGNIIAYHNNGDVADPSDSLYAVIQYYTDTTDRHLVGIPVSIATLYNNNVLRYRESDIDSLTGKLKQLRIYNDTVVSVCDYTYDMYGNTDTVRLPENHRHQRMVNVYEYDTIVHTYPVRVRNALGYVYEASYDYRFGSPVATTDINGNVITYTYDWRGRLKKVKSPYDPDSSLTFKYWFEDILMTPPGTIAHVPWAITYHYDEQHPTNAMTTVLFTDALGREIQMKKDVEISSTEQHTVSGKVIYDAYGRVITTYYPVTELTSVLYKTFNTNVDNITPTTITYDLLDRQTSVTLPNGATTTMIYGFGNDAYAKKRFTTITTDPLNNSVTVYKDVRGLQTTVSAPMSATTKFIYNRLGELIESTNPDGYSTSYVYDNLGQRLTRTHPDAGTDVYIYDPAGNLISHKNQLLLDSNREIRYHYTYRLLDSIVYPENPENNVYYQYGTPSDTGNCTGRIKFMEDGSGWQKFSYGPLGEITENIRTFVLFCNYPSYTFKTKYCYDTWNRLKSMTYPDGEIVTYTYDRGGNLKTMTGEKMGDTYTYIVNIHYNKFEKKVVIEYGNGVITYYDYDDELHRLARLVTENSQGDRLQYNKYEYDDVNNILSIKSRGNILDNLVGESINTYTYDNLYRLIYSTNYDNGVPPDKREYELTMQYTVGGRITEKTQYAKTLLNNQSEIIDNQYTYSYYSNQPHTLQSIDGYHTQFAWDANGNLVWAEKYRLLVWDEDNRLAGVSDENEGLFCFYDANGERTLKLSTNSIYLTINGQEMKDIQVTKAVMYASPYWVVDEKCYSKHYYAGSDRICSKIGRGISSYWYEEPLVGTNDSLYDKKKKQVYYLYRIAYKLEEYEPEFYCNWQGNPDIILNLELPKLDSLNTYESECYYYHTDHIGSTSWITDVNGGWIQYCEYLPFGEPLVDQRSYKWNSRYTFSGKERDGETGYSYFGARYYNSDLSIWLSVDPMADKYPNLTPYAYCANNPIILVDPDGREWEDIDGNKITDHSKIKVYIFYNPEDFGSQSKQMYKDAVAKYGEGSVAMSNVTTTAEFAQDWGDMGSNDIQEVNINHHGGSQTLTLDAHVEKSKEYITATGTGKTPAGRPAKNVEDLPTPSGNVQNAQLNINSCKSNNTSANLKGSRLTLAQSFRNNTDFRSVRTTSQNVSYHNWFSPNRPHPQDHSNWQFLNRLTPFKYHGVGLPHK